MFFIILIILSFGFNYSYYVYNIVFNKDGKIRFKISPAEICSSVVPDRTSIFDSRYLWHTIVEYYVSPTYIFIVPFCFKRARFHLYIQKKNKYFLDIFKPFSPFYCFNWVNLLFYEFTFAPNNNLAQNVFFKESSNLMCTIQITKCSLKNI